MLASFIASSGVAPVTFNAIISEVAEDWPNYMAADGFRHSPIFHLDSRVGDGWTADAENIAANHENEGKLLKGKEPHDENPWATWNNCLPTPAEPPVSPSPIPVPLLAAGGHRIKQTNHA